MSFTSLQNGTSAKSGAIPIFSIARIRKLQKPKSWAGQLVQSSKLSFPDQKFRGQQNRETIAGRSKNLDEVLSIKREKNISPSQCSDQNWSILARWKNQGSINGYHIIDKRNSGTQSDPCCRGFKRKFGKILFNLVTNPWAGDDLPALI